MTKPKKQDHVLNQLLTPELREELEHMCAAVLKKAAQGEWLAAESARLGGRPNQILAAAIAQMMSERLRESVRALGKPQSALLSDFVSTPFGAELGNLILTVLDHGNHKSWLFKRAGPRKGSCPHVSVAAVIVQAVFARIGGPLHSAMPSLPSLPDDEELKAALRSLVQSAMFFQGLSVAVLSGDDPREALKDRMAYLELSEKVIQNWADYLEVRPE